MRRYELKPAWRSVIMLIALLVVGSATQATALEPEKPGRWTFKHPDRPQKAVIVGGSVSAWPRGNYGHFLHAACPNVEIVNRGKARLGAKALHKRVKMQLFKNRKLNLDDGETVWLIFHGGLNSIASPLSTNRWVAKSLKLAHDGGLKTIAMTVGPWGSEADKRWKRAAGLSYRTWTQQSVDFIVGSLTPEEAFGPSRAGTDYEPGERPDIAVNIYDSDLRDRDAAPRTNPRMARYVKVDKWVKRQLRELPDDAREARLQTLTEMAITLPQWFMRKALHAFDHVHPNMEGHRVIASTMCPKMPQAWGCQCDTIPALAWDRKAGKLVVQTDGED